MLIQFDAEPQQTIMLNLQMGMQILMTINMEDLIDRIALQGRESVAFDVGNQLIDLLETNGNLLDSIDPQKHINDVKHLVEGGSA